LDFDVVLDFFVGDRHLYTIIISARSQPKKPQHWAIAVAKVGDRHNGRCVCG
jgi:hypothetical protein